MKSWIAVMMGTCLLALALACGGSDSNSASISGAIDSGVISKTSLSESTYEVWALQNDALVRQGTITAGSSDEDHTYLIGGLTSGQDYVVTVYRVVGFDKIAIMSSVVTANSSSGQQKTKTYKRQMNMVTTYIASKAKTSADVATVTKSIFGTAQSLDSLVSTNGELTGSGSAKLYIQDTIAQAAVTQLTFACVATTVLSNTDVVAKASDIKSFVSAVSGATTMDTIFTHATGTVQTLVNAAINNSSATAFGTRLSEANKIDAATFTDGENIKDALKNLTISTLVTKVVTSVVIFTSNAGGTVIDVATMVKNISTKLGGKHTIDQAALTSTINTGAVKIAANLGHKNPLGLPPPGSTVAKPSSPVVGNKSFDIKKFKDKDPLAKSRVNLTVARGKAMGRGKASLPASVNWGSKVPTPQNQGQTGSCTAWAAGYYKSYQEALEEGWDINAKRFSPMFIFSMASRNFKNFNETSPYSSDLAAEVLKAYGCPLDSELPYKDYEFGANPNPENDAKEIKSYAEHPISEAVMASARNYKNGDKFTDFMYYDSATSKWKMKYDALKAAVAEGPVMIGISGFEGPKSSSPEENFFFPATNAAGHGAGHAILLIGYDDAKFGGGAWLCRNSWGIDSGEKGDTWIKYADQTLINSAMTIKDLPNLNRVKPTAATIDAPNKVSATTDAGSIVITWSKVKDATYYNIYRSADPGSTGKPKYAKTGKSDTNTFEDFPASGNYLYLVQSVNPKVESKFSPTDREDKAYVAKGMAIKPTTVLTAPTLQLLAKSKSTATISVTNHGIYDATKTGFQVLVAGNVAGPWTDFGIVKVSDKISVDWGTRGDFAGSKPVIRFSALTSNGDASPFSNIVECGQVEVVVDSTIKNIKPTLTGTVSANVDSTTGALTLSWTAATGATPEYYTLQARDVDTNGKSDWYDIDSTTSNSYVVDAVPPAQSYIFGVTAWNAGVQSETIESSTITMSAPPGDNALEIVSVSSTNTNTTTRSVTFTGVTLINRGLATLDTTKLNLHAYANGVDVTDDTATLFYTTEYSSTDLSSANLIGSTTMASGASATFDLTFTYSTAAGLTNTVYYWDLEAWEDNQYDTYSKWHDTTVWTADTALQSQLSTVYDVAETLDSSIAIDTTADDGVIDLTGGSITLTVSASSVAKGGNLDFIAYTSAPGLSANLSETYTWTTTDPTVATVSGNTGSGNFLAHEGGIVTVSVFGDISGFEAMQDITVIVPTVLVTGGDNVYVGKSITLVAATTPSGVIETYTWTSSDESIAVVGPAGNVVGKGNGMVAITATGDESKIAGTKEIKVIQPEVTIGGGSASLATSQSTTFTASTTPAVTEFYLWSSSNTSVASATSSGLVTAVGPGTATITATGLTSGGVATTEVTVEATTVGVTAASSATSLAVGATLQLTAATSPSSVTEAYTWSSSDTSLATVSPSGLVTGVAAGTVVVTATGGNTQSAGNISLTVTAP